MRTCSGKGYLYIRAADRRNSSHAAGLPTIRAMVSWANVDMAFAFLDIWASYLLQRKRTARRPFPGASFLFQLVKLEESDVGNVALVVHAIMIGIVIQV